jgi:hypothetical protein
LGCSQQATEAVAEKLASTSSLAELKSQEARQARLSAAQLNKLDSAKFVPSNKNLF